MPKKSSDIEDFEELEEMPSRPPKGIDDEPEDIGFEQTKSAEPEIVSEPAEEIIPIADEPDPNVISSAGDIPVTVTAVIGKTKTTVRDLIEYKPGFVIDLHRSPGETVDIMAGGKLIARGELVDMDGKLAVKILKMLR